MTWVDIAHWDALPIDRGVAAIVGDDLVAVFRLADGEVLAIDHVDPFSGVPLLARGLVGCVQEQPVVFSPLDKRRFDLRTGECLDDPTLTVSTWAVDVVDGRVLIAATALEPHPPSITTSTTAVA
jgi:nitrite reductase (NADH) small subunit